jgi:hypothetical protein
MGKIRPGKLGSGAAGAGANAADDAVGIVAGKSGGAVEGAFGGPAPKLMPKKVAPAPSKAVSPRPVQGPAAPARAVKCSFLAGTAVLMADGSHKNIEDLQPGDQVTATDPETSDTRPRTVLEPLTEKGENTLVTITIDLDGKHGSKTAKITATDNHPFWAPDYARWANAGDLKPGMWLRTSTGTWIQITIVTHRTVQSQRVYNLTVAGDHTYYVRGGVASVLVHNCKKDQGVYIFDDISKPGHVYVGQTSGISRRLGQHYRLGRRQKNGEVICVHVCGGRTERMIMEYIIKIQFQKMGIKLSSLPDPEGGNLYLARKEKATQLVLPDFPAG